MNDDDDDVDNDNNNDDERVIQTYLVLFDLGFKRIFRSDSFNLESEIKGEGSINPSEAFRNNFF